MNQEEAFIEDIAEHPDDDTPRLVFADWLEEHGDEARAEFIRVQCRLAKMDEDAEGRGELARREKELLDVNEKRWLPEKRVLLSWQFKRGMLESASIKHKQFLKHAKRLFSVFPIKNIRLMAIPREDPMRDVVKCPQLARLRSLDLTGNKLSTNDLQTLIGSSNLISLNNLTLRGVGIASEGVREIVESALSRQLLHLDLSQNYFGAGAVEVLSGAHLAGLRSLILESNDLGSHGVELLAQSRSLGNITRLSLQHNRIGAPGIRALAHSRFKNVRDLNLSGNFFGEEGGLELARSPILHSLQELDLGATGIGSSAAQALFQSPVMAHVKNLSLSTTRLGSDGMTALAGSTVIPNLSRLDLRDNEIGDEGATALAHWPALAGVIRLNLAINGIRAFGLRPLVDSPHLAKLRVLDLQGNRLGDMGAQIFARWPGLVRLSELNLSNNDIGDVGGCELGRSPHAKFLETIDLSGNNFTELRTRNSFEDVPSRRIIWDSEGVKS